MRFLKSFKNFKDEIELALIQNGGVEIELYSIIANLIRDSENGCKISLRDVSSRRKTKISSRYCPSGRFPDFVVLEREKVPEPEIFGCIEIKRSVKPLKEEDLKEEIEIYKEDFKKIIYTNGISWKFYGFDNDSNNKIVLGKMKKDGNIDWEDDNWDRLEDDNWNKLLEKLNNIKWDDKIIE
ncbi:hypothetical protein HIF96_08620 [Helcococcus kunzii]|uniref:hypothetical protein n=1 Tax=Helcococcus kunzii TaxID=40091 RepID=UPI001C95614C|nr:hypothetical protein [Helcococcus kunzii]QZO76336.1 hypothetical protein HIF96_08620 [Helcococcus kunzii]